MACAAALVGVRPAGAQTTELELALTAAAAGRTVSVAFSGDGLGFARTLWTSFRAETRLDPEAKARSDRTGFLVAVPEKCPVGIGMVRLASSNRFSGPILVMVDSLPSIASVGGNRTLAQAQRIQLPVAVDGACPELGSEFFIFSARAGQRVSVDVVAQRVGSAFDPWVRLLDARGRELAFSEDSPGAGADARLTQIIPADGDYVVQLRDSRHQGGEAYRYRLRMGDFPLAPLPFLNDATEFVSAGEAGLKLQTETEPNDSTGKASRLELPALIVGGFQTPDDVDVFEFPIARPGRWLIQGHTRSRGSACDVWLNLLNSQGQLLESSRPVNADDGVITNAFAAAGIYRLRVAELNRVSGRDAAYRISVQPYVGFSLSVEADKYEVSAGGEWNLKVTAVRRDYDGPIALTLAGDARGFALTNRVIAARKSETTVRVIVPETLVPGTLLHLQVHGAGDAGDAQLTAVAQTLPALRKSFPNLPHPPAAFDGLISLGVLPSGAASGKAKTPESKPGTKPPKKS